MNATIWLVILAAFLAANVPFMNERWLGLVRSGVRTQPHIKPLWGRLLEMLLWYFLVGLLARWLEQRTGQIYPQGWEFYAVTGTLFLTLAFPGFVYRYLGKRSRD